MGTKRRIVTANRELTENYMNDGATDVLTKNEDGLDLEAIVDVAVILVDRIIHTTFKNDSLVLLLAKSNGHQNGEYNVGPWHVYKNPNESHLCPVLELSRYLFIYP